MADLNAQAVIFTASGLLSAQKGPQGVGFPVAASGSTPRKWRIMGVKAVLMTGTGSFQIFDATSAQVAPSDEVFGGDKSETATNLGIYCRSGDIYVQITGAWKIYLYLDLNA